MSAPATVRPARSDAEILACFPVIAQLRPHLDAGGFLPRVRRMEETGFRMAFVRDGGAVRAVAGFRFLENLATGRVLYVDDLVTDGDARSRGHGRLLLDWLVELARAEACDTLELDSGVQRAEAHRFYFRERMHVSSFHFRRRLAP